ncbi:chemotaxis protein CheX [Herbinix luporum]|uniref:chemotaxis protein CheX n=1 Tax=Herbinix luporum TaxID=1679721 RepID=UPI001773FEC3|nr:chemotaxis protein CheX [Herbinix luporum]HHT56054.1 chemotaxis protein CheX [Herbinix luporum]
MAALNVDHINPFLLATSKILKEMCFIEPKMDKPSIKEAVFLDNTLLIIIGFTGKIKGQVIIAFEHNTASDIASKMIMMPVTEMDDFAVSAISELGNMILGNAATIFSTQGIDMDITPPTIGKGTMSFSHSYSKNICIPFIYDGDKRIEVNIAIKGL